MTTTDTPRTDDYYAGKGCECAAHNWSECGCDADWTDPRIYELEAEVERLGDRINRINNDNFNLANALSKAHEELCHAGLREYGN